MNNKVYILLPVHNRKSITQKFVSLLKQQDYSNYTLLLIDDGSIDGTAESICEGLPETIVLKGSGGWWWAGSLQQGYKWLKKQEITEEDIVLIMNDDTEIQKDFLSKGIYILNQNKRTLLLATAYDSGTNTLVDSGVSYNFKQNILNKPDENNPINCLSTRGLFLKATDFIDLGGFHPRILPHYASDYEFTIRAYKKGYKLICSEEVKLWFDNLTTGFHGIGSYKWNEFRKIYFSKRYVDNPIYVFNYYLLSFPFPYNIKHGFMHLKQSIRKIFSVLKYNVIGKTN